MVSIFATDERINDQYPRHTTLDRTRSLVTFRIFLLHDYSRVNPHIVRGDGIPLRTCLDLDYLPFLDYPPLPGP